MKIHKIDLRNLIIIILIASGFIGCEQEFATIDSDIINDETATNFNTVSEKYSLISYTDRLNPVQTSGLGLNMLGVYDDPTYGRTTSSILTQVTSGLINPTFGEGVVLDSVVLTLPFFSRNVGVTEDNIVEYELDSVISTDGNLNSIKLSIFENTYFLRDFNPNEDFDTGQSYFSNKSASETESIGIANLEAVPIDVINELPISNDEVLLYDNDEEPNITQRLTPRIRVVWDNNDSNDDAVMSYWKNKIIDQEGASVLSNANNFNDYFRGLYFKAEPFNDKGSLMILNLTQQDANVTLFYSFDSSTIENEREQSSYRLTFAPTRVNFLENDYTLPFDNGDEINGDDRLFVKAGEGALAGIKLFGGENTDDNNATDNAFEAWRKQFVNVDEETGEFLSSRRLVNEANLIFYVDQNQVQGQEPERLYLFNRANGGPLIDYFEDTQNNTLPQISIPNHLGILERDGTDENKGLRYKMKITSHINNLLINNTENVELGLSVSGNINLEATVPQYAEQGSSTSVPVSTLITPRGTVLHGNNSEIEAKRLFLEIFYTCLETDIDCPNN